MKFNLIYSSTTINDDRPKELDIDTLDDLIKFTESIDAGRTILHCNHVWNNKTIYPYQHTIEVYDDYRE